MTAVLLPFNESAICPKCGWYQAEVRYCRLPKLGSECVVLFGQDIIEHLHRICGRCEYIWFEATLDSPPKSEPP